MAEKREAAPLSEDLKEFSQSLPKDKKRQFTHLAAKIERSSFSSPVPPPQFMEDYNRILPGSPERILAMAEKGQEADILARADLIKGKNNFHKYNFILDIFWGFVFLIIFLVVLAAGLLLVIYGHKDEALSLWGGGGFLVIIGAGLTAYFRRNNFIEKNRNSE